MYTQQFPEELHTKREQQSNFGLFNIAEVTCKQLKNSFKDFIVIFNWINSLNAVECVLMEEDLFLKERSAFTLLFMKYKAQEPQKVDLMGLFYWCNNCLL